MGMVISGVGVVSTMGEGMVLGVEVGVAGEAQLQLTMELTTPALVSFRNSRREIDGMVSSSRTTWGFRQHTDCIVNNRAMMSSFAGPIHTSSTAAATRSMNVG